MKIDGECHCGQVAYEAEMDPGNVGLCHCTDCQKLSGTAFRLTARVSGDSFRLLRGKPKKYVKIGGSGAHRAQFFCGNCGSDLYASDDVENPEKVHVRLGTVRQRGEIIPQFEGWCSSALSWLPRLANTQKADGSHP